jgi:Uma2 family endonuclease
MATATPTRHTPEELLQITDRPMPELIDGQFVEREPMGQKSDGVAAKALRLIGRFVDDHNLGLLNGAQGSYQIFTDDPDKVRIPDVSFTTRARLPKGGEEDGHGRVAPDLVVEVVSPNDYAVDVDKKVRDFLAAGVRLVWVFNPFTRRVQTYGPNGASKWLKEGDTLDGGDVLPGFGCAVESFFDI